MNIDDAKRMFETGVLESAMVMRDSSGSGWLVQFQASGTGVSPFLETARGEPRRFQSLDFVAKALQAIGFRQFTVFLERA